MSLIRGSRPYAGRNWFSLLAALGFLKTGTDAVAQNQAAANTTGDASTASTLDKLPVELTLGPLTLHPRVDASFTADDNILFTTKPVADTIWKFQPALQAVMGDDASLIVYRDQNTSMNVFGLTPGSLIVQPPEAWPGKLLVVDYSPRFVFYDAHSENNSIDEFAHLSMLWPVSRLILGFQQTYELQTGTIIEASRLGTTETIATTLALAYQFGEKTSLESDFHRIGLNYDQAGLTGYTEYNTEDWLNYQLTPDLPVSVGVLAGYDEVGDNQDQTYEQVRARVRYIFTQKMAFDASVGGELRQYENGKGDTFSPVFSLAAAYRPAERTTLSLTGYRQQSASIINGYNYASTGASLGLQQGITDRFTADVSVGYYVLDYTSVVSNVPSRADDYYTARLSLDVKILRHLNGQVYYNLISIQSSGGGDREDNQIGVNLTWGY